MTKQLTLTLLLFCCSCAFYRHDVTPDRDSVTVCTILKDINAVIDPNGIIYGSQAHQIKVITPYGIVESEDK